LSPGQAELFAEAVAAAVVAESAAPAAAVSRLLQAPPAASRTSERSGSVRDAVMRKDAARATTDRSPGEVRSPWRQVLHRARASRTADAWSSPNGTRGRLCRFTLPTRDEDDRSMTVSLYEPMTLRGVTMRNRIGVSPMCEYSSVDGFANDWHVVHLGSRAVGGAGLVLTEATAVTADGRISPHDLGIYRDEHVEALSRITRFITAQGAVPGTQLSHAGRKASTDAPWRGGRPLSPADGGWTPVWAPSPMPFGDRSPTPAALDRAGIDAVIAAFRDAAVRALDAGFQVIELHGAHGYLLHEFLSPLANQRTDEYGGGFENRIRLLLRVTEAVRSVWPERFPLLVRLSGTDWVPGGWDLEQSVALTRRLAPLGVDLVDCSSGGIVPGATIPVGPGYQVHIAERIRRDGAIATAAVGLITDPAQAEGIVRSGQADMVFLARELLRDPYWPLHAAKRLGASVTWPVQYQRAVD
jgi:2,4-dienoyl-CoA reductase-like NADH-dependent reductase (Old Yellow Enzyme family)